MALLGMGEGLAVARGVSLFYRSLGFQIAALVVCCLLGALFVSGAYVAAERASQTEIALKRDASIIGRELAGTLSVYLVVNDFISMEQTLRSFMVSSSLREVAVTDPAGQVLGQVRLGPEGQLHPHFERVILVPPASSAQLQSMDGEHLVTWHAAKVSDVVGWVRVVSDLESVHEDERRIYAETAIIAVAAFLAAISVSFLFLRPRLRALHSVTEFARGMSMVQREPLRVSDVCDEIQVLGATLNETAARLESSARGLRESEATLRAVVENMPVMLNAFDAKHLLVAWNKECERITGYSRDEVVGNPHALEKLFPDAEFRSEMLLRPGQSNDQFHNREADIVTKDGRRRVISWSNISAGYPIPGWQTWAVGVDVTGRVENERVKDEFISTVNHELRTPLTAIRGALALVRSGVVGELPDGIKNLVYMADRNSERLLLLINNILEVQKLESGHLQLERKKVDVASLVQSIIEINAPLAQHAGVGLVAQVDMPHAWVFIDELKIGQVLTNLISNAIKHTPKGRQVSVRVDVLGERVRTSVIDQGSGVPNHFHGLLFGRFSRAPEAQKAQITGSGLGLYISRRIIDQHGGVIDFSSPPGEGAVFYFELPIAQGLIGDQGVHG